MSRSRRAALACCAAVAAQSGAALAHSFDPWRLDVTSQGGGVYAMALKIARTGEDSEGAAASLHIGLPARCRAARAPADEPLRGAILRTWAVDCGAAGLAGAPIDVTAEQALAFEVVVRYRDGGPEVFTALLDRRSPRVTLPGRASHPSSLRLASRYVSAGIMHILSGVDHLLFVTCLMLLARGRSLVDSVTGFTLGHCVTLVLASLSVLRVPSAPVEACITASVVLLAAERLRASPGIRRAGAGVTCVFGLLHGLGFAGALAQIGLPSRQIPLALGAFNVGVELGQLAFVGAALALATVARRVLPTDPAQRFVGFAAGITAAWWTGDRLAACLWG